MNKTVDAKARRGRAASLPPLAERSDEALLEVYCRTGNRDAFDELVHRYERELYSYLRRYLGDAEMAEDVFQTTFLQVHLKRDTFESGRRFRPWLYTVATNQAIDAQRRNKRHRLISLDRRQGTPDGGEVGALLELLQSSETGPIEDLESKERRGWVRDAVMHLPDPLRAAVTLIYYQGLKYREAAEILKIPVGTVKSRLHAALLKLSEAWMRSDLAGDQ